MKTNNSRNLALRQTNYDFLLLGWIAIENFLINATIKLQNRDRFLTYISPNSRISHKSSSSSGTQFSATVGSLFSGDSGLRLSLSPLRWGVDFTVK